MTGLEWLNGRIEEVVSFVPSINDRRVRHPEGSVLPAGMVLDDWGRVSDPNGKPVLVGVKLACSEGEWELFKSRMFDGVIKRTNAKVKFSARFAHQVSSSWFHEDIKMPSAGVSLSQTFGNNDRLMNNRHGTRLWRSD